MRLVLSIVLSLHVISILPLSKLSGLDSLADKLSRLDSLAADVELIAVVWRVLEDITSSNRESGCAKAIHRSPVLATKMRILEEGEKTKKDEDRGILLSGG